MNTNCLEGLCCPKCLQEDKILMHTPMWVAMTDDGTDPFDDDIKNDGDTVWDADTPAKCPECGYEGTMQDFKLPPGCDGLAKCPAVRLATIRHRDDGVDEAAAMATSPCFVAPNTGQMNA